jgi:hypothetical protein
MVGQSFSEPAFLMQTRRTSVLFDSPPSRNRDAVNIKPDLAPPPPRPHSRRSSSHGDSVERLLETKESKKNIVGEG